MHAKYLATIGLEVHVQLKTKTKIWCSCPNHYGDAPNTNICPVCLGYPGSLPVLNEEAVRLTVLTGLMLDCEINMRSKHDRKSYFYPDMPKNYQISQYDQPLCLGGALDIGERKIKLTRIHLEEDVAKNTHFETSSCIDFNRAGTPLMEIVTEPDMHSADEAFAFLVALKQMLAYAGVSACNLEEGNVRCDINCSVSVAESDELGVKTEIKNMNTFKGVHRALSYEIERQAKALEEGREIVQETRRWDDETDVTQSMRSKEYAHDYRYFPDPDLMPIAFTQEYIANLKCALPEMPQVRRTRFVKEYGLPDYDSEILVQKKNVADYYEAAVKAGGNPKTISNWMMTEMLRALSETGIEIEGVKISPEKLSSLIKLVEKRIINQNTAKEVFNILFEQGGEPEKIVEENAWGQVSDSEAIETFVTQAIEEHKNVTKDYQSGKKSALQFLVGQVMRLSKGKANPQMAAEMLREKLSPT